LKINKKVKKKAFLMALSSKAKDKEIVVVDNLKVDKPKTKEMVKILNKLPLKKKSVLLVVSRPSKKISRIARNIPNLLVSNVKSLNTLELLSYKYLLITKAAIDELNGIKKEKQIEKAKD